MKLLYPPEYEKVIKAIIRKAKRNGVKLIFSETATVGLPGSEATASAGYFHDDKPRVLAVAIDTMFDKWILTLLHESCHMDQCLEGFNIPNETEHYNLFFEWLDGRGTFNKKQLTAFVKTIIAYERDCEERTIKKIIKYNLPIDTESYIQAANTYFALYYLFIERRKWYNHIYGQEKVTRFAPKIFTDKIPARLKRAIRERADELDLQNPT